VAIASGIYFTRRSPSTVASMPNYVDPKLCAGCHANIWATYRFTGMARSFYRPSSANTIEDYTRQNTFYHRISDSYFTMLLRDGRYYQRRHQIGFGGKETNVEEKEIHYVMGSGNHVRTYLHRTSRNTLVELPLAWYAEKGGYWAMNPGYDRADHQGFRRKVSYDCMFCHNGYPEKDSIVPQFGKEPVFSARLPEGIDCQRCHGPGGKHVSVAQAPGSATETIRGTIVNPARLSPDREMEVCMQCHLETTSFPLPNSIQRYERAPFSYHPGEPLANFILYFDHAPGKGHDDKFEIAHAVYRLRRSACFQKSNGQMRCTTCHNPHDIPRGEQARQHYIKVCRQCHDAHPTKQVATDCLDCHMPKRRTEDVVHAVMTDHYIQRHKPTRNLLAEITERHETGANAYHGEVAPYYPAPLAATPENELYHAIVQVKQQSNLQAGIARLTEALEKQAPQRPEYYFELGDAWWTSGLTKFGSKVKITSVPSRMVNTVAV
jgi:predicted CXXCH cytochrome family protein